jgi:hypothetical protein
MAHTKRELAELEAGAKLLDELRHEPPFCDWSDARWHDFLVSELAADDGVDLRASLKKFEGDDPELRAAALRVCQHPKLKPLLPH